MKKPWREYIAYLNARLDALTPRERPGIALAVNAVVRERLCLRKVTDMHEHDVYSAKYAVNEVLRLVGLAS